MSKQVKLRRGTAEQHTSFTGVVGEVTVDTTNHNLRVHDGATVGGNPTAKAGANTDITSLKQDVAITASGTIAATSIGYRGLPQNAQTSAYTIVSPASLTISCALAPSRSNNTTELHTVVGVIVTSMVSALTVPEPTEVSNILKRLVALIYSHVAGTAAAPVSGLSVVDDATTS